MRQIRHYILLSLVFLVISCKENAYEYIRTPVIEMNFNSFYMDGVLMDIRSINTDAVYGVALKTGETEPTAEYIIQNGVLAENQKLFIGGLEKETDYNIYGLGTLGTAYGKIVTLTITTPSLYDWESSRTEIPTFSDLDLLSGGISNKTPKDWDENRLKPHVTFTDSDGREKFTKRSCS